MTLADDYAEFLQRNRELTEPDPTDGPLTREIKQTLRVAPLAPRLRLVPAVEQVDLGCESFERRLDLPELLHQDPEHLGCAGTTGPVSEAGVEHRVDLGFERPGLHRRILSFFARGIKGRSL